ncbi:hypothetical protein GKE73_16905 [Paludibacterium sp. dN 18-1]|uniref:Uncharacterized protein n=2 Tax=Paludibacterium denitrificans TaxID=2675226 RepID=A0A844GFU5_9NEIS|nr:hypothetical protein [Paludibacterium denitrificans]
MDAAKEQITILMNAIRQSFADGTAVQLGHNIATAINAIGEICRVTVGFVNQHSEAIKLLVETWLGAKILTQAIIWLGGISSALTALQTAASVKTVIGISLNKSGMAGAASEISSLFGLLSKIPSLTTLTFATVGITAAVAAISAINTVLDIQNEKLQRKLKLMGEIDDLQRQGVKDNRSGSETSVLTPDQLSGYSKEDLAKYQNDLKRAHDINNKMATQQYQTVMDKGGDPEKDAEYRKRFDNTILYAKALKDLEKYQANRLQIEERYSKTVDGVRKGQLANLAESLAKEQKLYDKYNDLLKQATDTRLKHQDAWAGKKGTDPAEKAKDPQDMGTTDFFEGQAKASSLSRKAQDSLATYKQSGKDEDLRKYRQDAAAAEKQFQSLSDVIDKLREAGKITKGEYDWMNQSAGSLQDGFDAKTENSAKDKLQEVMAKIESLKQAAESVKNLQIGFDTEKGMRDLESLMASFEQAAHQRPIQIPTQFVGPDGKYLTDARKDVGLLTTPYSPADHSGQCRGWVDFWPGYGDVRQHPVSTIQR